MTHGDGGKGSARRPMAVSDQDYSARWDAIFGRDKPTKRLHAMRHDGWGTWSCMHCGRPEKYTSHDEECPGEKK